MIKLPLFQKGRSGGLEFTKKEGQTPQSIFFGSLLFIALFFALLFIRLFQLTIVKGQYYRRLAEQNRVRELVVEPRRGEIRDRKGFVIAKNLPADIAKSDQRLLSSRIYENPEAVAPLVGYRQIADQNDLKDDRCLTKLKAADKVGKKGVEKIFDCPLRGRPGKKLIEVDAEGKFLRTLTVLPPTDGQTIQLALDLILQKKAYEQIKDKKGAIVALKPKTGEVLALVSTPSSSPQDFEEKNEAAMSKYLTDENKPLFNRTTEGLYPPGSIFKLVVAAAALEEKKIDEKTLIEDTGLLKAGPLTFGNWYFLEYGKTEGMVDIIKAIRRSNDIFFYKAGEKTGVEKIKTWAERLGYGRKTGIGFEEAEGLIPSPFWKQDSLKDRWYLGDTYNFSIGQGYINVAPLQVALSTAVFANGGYLCQPQLVKMNSRSEFILSERSESKEPITNRPNCKKLPISNKTLNLIREGMKQACSPGGTGWPLFDFKIQTACKTGTAESHAASKIPHAWFTVFAPYDDPEIVLTVLVEEGGQGSDVAGPIAKEILKTYFERSE